jgi:uncharacterized membrane protein
VWLVGYSGGCIHQGCQYVIVTERTGDGAVVYILRPNRSLDWRGNLRFYGLISLVSLCIACWFAWLGAWIVLPFAGLELLALGLALYLVSMRGLDMETIEIQGDTLEICKGRRQIRSTTRLQRCWARVRLEPSAHTWYPSRLMIRSHGKGTEIGSFLGSEEKEKLAGELMHSLRQAVCN